MRSRKELGVELELKEGSIGPRGGVLGQRACRPGIATMRANLLRATTTGAAATARTPSRTAADHGGTATTAG